MRQYQSVMSRPSKTGGPVGLGLGSNSTSSIQAQLDKAKYAEPPMTRSSIPAVSIDDKSILDVVSKALQENIISQASSHEALLSEKNSLSASLKFEYTWRNKMSPKEIAAAKAEAELAGKTYVPQSSSEYEPLPVSFDVSTLNKAFGGKVDFSKPQHLLSAYIESEHSTAPVPLNWTLNNVQGKALHKVFSNDGTASTAALPPNVSWKGEREVYRLSNVDASSLYTYGNVDVGKEAKKLIRKGTSEYFVPTSGFFGKTIADNYDTFVEGGEKIGHFAEAGMYLVNEKVVSMIMKDFHEQVLSNLKPTNFSAIQGVLTRGDRTAMSTLPFGDMSDACGLGTMVSRQSAAAATHRAEVVIRLHVIDPAKLREDIVE